MNVIVFGATGGLGQWMWKAAVAGGHRVKVFVRSPGKLNQAAPGYDELEVVQGDVMDADAVRAASRDCQVAVNCTSPAAGNSALEMARSIVEQASASGVASFYMVGGVGALWAPGTDKTVLVQDWEDAEAMAKFGLRAEIPKETVRQMTRGHLASMAFMQQAGVPHTFVCPGMMLDAPATAARVVTLDELGSSRAMQVNMGDIAAVVVDDLDRGALLGHRISVVSS